MMMNPEMLQYAAPHRDIESGGGQGGPINGKAQQHPMAAEVRKQILFLH